LSQSSEFCPHNPLCCFSTSVCCCYCLFRYLLSPETFGYTLVQLIFSFVKYVNNYTHCYTSSSHITGRLAVLLNTSVLYTQLDNTETSK